MRRKIFRSLVVIFLGIVGSVLCLPYNHTLPAHADARSASSYTQPATANPSPLTVSITSVSTPTLRPESTLRVQAEITNTSASDITIDAQLRGTDTFTTRNHLLAFIEMNSVQIEKPQETLPIATLPAPMEVKAHSHASITLEANVASLGWSAQGWGPRGVEVVATSTVGNKESASDRTFIVVEPSDTIAAVPTGIVVPLSDSHAELTSLYTAKDITAIRTEPTERITRLAQTMTMNGVSVIADPAYGDLSRAPQTILCANGDADILTLLDMGRKNLAQSLLPDSFTKSAVPVRVNYLASADAFATYHKLGASAFILDSSWLSVEQNVSATPATHALLDGSDNLDVLLNDIVTVRSVLDAPNRLHARQNALALSAMTYLEQPSTLRPQLLYFDLTDDILWKVDSQGKVLSDYSQLAEAASALMAAPWVQPAQLSDLLATPASSTVSLPEQLDSAPSASVITEHAFASIDHSIARATRLAGVVATPDTVTTPVTKAAVYLYSHNWHGDSASYSNALRDFSALTTRYAKAISPISLSTINLVAEQADIPVQVENTLTIPATVTVALDSVDARLSAKSPVTLDLAPQSTTTVSIPVTARGSGNVQAHIHVYNSHKQDISTPLTVKIRVRASWENSATIILGLALAFVLIIGIIRSSKKGRRSLPVNLTNYTQTQRKVDAEFRVNHSRQSQSHDSP